MKNTFHSWKYIREIVCVCVLSSSPLSSPFWQTEFSQWCWPRPQVVPARERKTVKISSPHRWRSVHSQFFSYNSNVTKTYRSTSQNIKSALHKILSRIIRYCFTRRGVSNSLFTMFISMYTYTHSSDNWTRNTDFSLWKTEKRKSKDFPETCQWKFCWTSDRQDTPETILSNTNHHL